MLFSEVLGEESNSKVSNSVSKFGTLNSELLIECFAWRASDGELLNLCVDNYEF